jgi:RNA polymerase sigma factor (sigma-70 family)
MTDGELVRRALDGDAAAYGELARRWSARVLAFCQVKSGCRHVAEDLAQETLLRGLRGLSTLECPERFGSWLQGIAQRVFLDWRKAKQTSQVPLSALGQNETVENLFATESDVTMRSVDRDDDLRRLRQAVETLDEEFREVVTLYYSADVTYAELAQILDVSPATVNARLTKARAALRERLSPTES